MTTTIDHLESGAHGPEAIRSGHACFVEAASCKAGPPAGDDDWEPSDRDRRICPVVAAFGRSMNDNLGDEDRQRLLPYLDRIVGTKGTPEQEEARGWLVTDWMVHRHLPLWLRAAGMEEQATAVEALPAVTGRSAWIEQCRDVVDQMTVRAREVRAEWRQRIREAVEAEFQRRGLADVAVAVAAAVAAAADVAADVAADADVAVAAAAAAAAAADVAVDVDADVAAAAAAAADVAVAVAAAAAVDVAVAVAVAAAAAAAVDVDAAVAVAVDQWSEAYGAVRRAIRERLRVIYRERLGDTQVSSLQSGLDLLDELIAVTAQS